MTYEEFLKFVPAKCIYETIYEDTEGRPILVISLLDAYGMVNKAQRPWVGLTDEAKAVIAAAKVAMDASFETENRELDISIPAHLATALSLRLDEFEAALRSKNHD